MAATAPRRVAVPWAVRPRSMDGPASRLRSGHPAWDWDLRPYRASRWSSIIRCTGGMLQGSLRRSLRHQVRCTTSGRARCAGLLRAPGVVSIRRFAPDESRQAAVSSRRPCHGSVRAVRHQLL